MVPWAATGRKLSNARPHKVSIVAKTACDRCRSWCDVFHHQRWRCDHDMSEAPHTPVCAGSARRGQYYGGLVSSTVPAVPAATVGAPAPPAPPGPAAPLGRLRLLPHPVLPWVSPLPFLLRLADPSAVWQSAEGSPPGRARAGAERGRAAGRLQEVALELLQPRRPTRSFAACCARVS